jgi:hypothetical protein
LGNGALRFAVIKSLGNGALRFAVIKSLGNGALRFANTPYVSTLIVFISKSLRGKIINNRESCDRD